MGWIWSFFFSWNLDLPHCEKIKTIHDNPGNLLISTGTTFITYIFVYFLFVEIFPFLHNRRGGILEIISILFFPGSKIAGCVTLHQNSVYLIVKGKTYVENLHVYLKVSWIISKRQDHENCLLIGSYLSLTNFFCKNYFT